MQAGPQALTLKCADGYPLAATAFRAAGAAKGAVVLAPALGVPRKFYFAFAQYLAERGYDALCFDYRGSGDSVRGPQRGRDMRMQTTAGPGADQRAPGRPGAGGGERAAPAALPAQVLGLPDDHVVSARPAAEHRP